MTLCVLCYFTPQLPASVAAQDYKTTFIVHRNSENSMPPWLSGDDLFATLCVELSHISLICPRGDDQPLEPQLSCFKYGRSVPCHGWAAGSQFDMEVRTRGGFPAAGRQPSCQGCIQACHTDTHTNTNAHLPHFLAAIRHRRLIKINKPYQAIKLGDAGAECVAA